MKLESVREFVFMSVCVLALGWFQCGTQAQAVEFGSGELEASLDTTISYGLTFRVGKRDKKLAADVNYNDGNHNYKRGIVSNAFKLTNDLDLGYRNFGLFVRASGFFDFENENGSRERTPLSPQAKAFVGKDIDVLDAYLTGAFEVGDAAVDVRLGKHVLNWGESTFIQNGVNAINPFDVSKLRVPGAELREALLAIPMVSVSVAPTPNLSVEGFYQLDWEKTEIDPVGSYFSVVDYVGPGAEQAVIALPGLDLGDMGLTAENNPFTIFSRTSVAGAFSAVTEEDPDFLIVGREADHDPGDSGQWGIAFRYLAEGLNNTEFGFYYMNYHSRLPVVSAHTGTAADAGAGLKVAGDMFAAAGTAVPEIVQAAVTAALTAAQCPSPAHSPQCGAIASSVQTVAATRAKAAAGAAAQAAGIDRYANGIDRDAESGHYFIEYPENIQLYGVSFNTVIGTTGWALQGEYSYRRDAPLALAERKVFADALGPFTGCLRRSAANPADGPACIRENAAAGLYDADTVGYVLRDVSQVQATATKVFGPVLGSDSGAFVTEVALMHVHSMPDGNGVASASLTPSDLPLESPAGGVGDDFNDADATSWGYRLAARLDYNNAVGAVNLFPYLQLGHGVSGNSPSPSGSFVEGRTALTLGLRAVYLSRWEANLGYTQFAGRRNKLRDRDFITATVKYSF